MGTGGHVPCGPERGALTVGHGVSATPLVRGLQFWSPRTDGVVVIIVLLAAWVLGGLLVALLVGGAVRLAEQRPEPARTVDPAATPTRVPA